MINDYRFQAEPSGGGASKRLLKRSRYPLLLVGFSAVLYSTVYYETPGIDTENTNKSDSAPVQNHTRALALPPSTLESAPQAAKNTPQIHLGEASTISPQTAETDHLAFATAPAKSGLEIPINPQLASNSTVTDELQTSAKHDDSRNDDEIVPIESTTHWVQEKVKKGDSLSRIFARLNLSPGLLHRIVNSGKKAQRLAHIKPGETLKVKTDEEGNFLGLILQRNAIKSLHIDAVGDEFSTRTVERGLEKRIANTSGIITNSLYQSAKRASLSDQLIMELANIFGWDIDFALEIRAGDSFSLVYEEEYLDGELYENGSILAAEFINRGKVFRAIRYQDQMGNINYFSPDGSSMRKAFLRAPVDFRRISSRFTKARWHPVLGKKRPHKGVDYAAAIGTPIKASGDGRVIFRGNKGGYGKAVIIKHGSQYTTLYGHLSRFKSSVTTGTRVKQGQVIGYVGKTGLATGPHLHYEFRVNGVHRNPLTVKIPAASPIAKVYKTDFEKKSKPLLAQLDAISRTLVATAE